MQATAKMNKRAVQLVCVLLCSVVSYLILNQIGLEQKLSAFVAVTACFILMITCDVFPTMLISMVLPCAYTLCGLVDASTALSPWTNTLMYLVAAGIILSNVLSSCGLLRRIALTFIRKFGSTFPKLVFALYVACLLMACLSFCQAWLLMFTLAISLCKTMGYKAGDKEATVLMMASFCGALTSTVYTYNPAYAPLLESAYQASGVTTAFQWYHMYLYMLPYIPICILFLWLIIKLFHVDKSSASMSREFANAELEKMGRISKQEWYAAGVLAFLVLFLITSSWHGMNILFGFLAGVVFLFCPGIDVGKKEDVLNVNMGTIAFMVACMSIGVVGAAVGFDSFVADNIGPILSTCSESEILYSIFGLGAVTNFFMTPLAILACFLNIVPQLASSLGINPLGAIYTLYASVDFYILPYENAWALVFFGLGMVKYKDFVRLNLLRSLMLAVALGLLFIPWWKLLGIV